jgi:hypothetical protein
LGEELQRFPVCLIDVTLDIGLLEMFPIWPRTRLLVRRQGKRTSLMVCMTLVSQILHLDQVRLLI